MHALRPLVHLGRTPGLRESVCIALLASAMCGPPAHAQAVRQSRIRITFGHRAAVGRTHPVRLVAGRAVNAIGPLLGIQLEANDTVGTDSRLHVGAGDIDGVEALVTWREPVSTGRIPHSIWQYLLDHTDPEASRRLRDDPALVPDAPTLTVKMSDDGTLGFTLGLQSLERTRAMWLPEHDAYVTIGEMSPSLPDHLARLRGRRTLDRVRAEPEASYSMFTGRWEDVGDPDAWKVPWQTSWLGTTGHLVVLAPEYGSLAKFAVDPRGNVRPDRAAAQPYRLDFDWGERRWAGQRLSRGLPVLVTRMECAGQSCEVEQIAAPFPRSGAGRGGVLLTKLRLSGKGGPFRIGIRFALEGTTGQLEQRFGGGRWAVTDRQSGAQWISIAPDPGVTARPVGSIGPSATFDWSGDLSEGKTRELVLSLASPPLGRDDRGSLDSLDSGQVRAAVIGYWESWLARGVRFEVPDPEVNDLFRASLWHAMRLPRVHAVVDGPERVDLPYSNTAYGQKDADWPINQAVYVDYMLYGLRGYFDIADREFAAMFRSQQQGDGRIGGYANWGVYSPSMLYAIGQNYLLSRDRVAFHRLLPQAIRTLDWCLGEVAKARKDGEFPGLVRAPLNDLTHGNQIWAFNAAYYFAGLETFARALEIDGNPRAGEVRSAAESMRRDVERTFARASVRSPVVELADGTWINHVPSDPSKPRRLLEQWYPSDVDTGPVHLARLRAIDPRGLLATAMLHDHEDNLFLRQWGAANEPVYNPQATAYLLRDEPEAAIRTFYSTMGCAFSRGQLEPIEHRWAWKQYFGPPSTDGAWFELYRNLIVADSPEALRVGQATPRAWLADGKEIVAERAPTWCGPVSVRIRSEAARGIIRADVSFLSDRRPATLLVRLRHPSRRRLDRVEVNGVTWTNFDPINEWVKVVGPKAATYSITARY